MGRHNSLPFCLFCFSSYRMGPLCHRRQADVWRRAHCVDIRGRWRRCRDEIKAIKPSSHDRSRWLNGPKRLHRHPRSVQGAEHIIQSALAGAPSTTYIAQPRSSNHHSLFLLSSPKSSLAPLPIASHASPAAARYACAWPSGGGFHCFYLPWRLRELVGLGGSGVADQQAKRRGRLNECPSAWFLAVERLPWIGCAFRTCGTSG
jgi:hypothetical protein